MLVISTLRAAVAVWRKRDSDLGPARAEAKDSARQLYPAMAAATIRRVGPTQEKGTFHSFRHTFAKRALESGAQITWLSTGLCQQPLGNPRKRYCSRACRDRACRVRASTRAAK